jgi:hypothetical protein
MNKQTVAAYVLRALTEAQIEGRASSLETLTSDIQVRKVDIRAVVTSLHREGYLDALRMRLTLRGFAVGRALMEEQLRELRPKSAATPAITPAVTPAITPAVIPAVTPVVISAAA